MNEIKRENDHINMNMKNKSVIRHTHIHTIRKRRQLWPLNFMKYIHVLNF